MTSMGVSSCMRSCSNGRHVFVHLYSVSILHVTQIRAFRGLAVSDGGLQNMLHQVTFRVRAIEVGPGSSLSRPCKVSVKGVELGRVSGRDFSGCPCHYHSSIASYLCLIYSPLTLYDRTNSLCY